MSVHISGRCRIEGCTKAAVRDGYCVTCSDYALQKQTMNAFMAMASSFQTAITSLNNTTEKLQTLEHKLDAILAGQPVVVQQQVIQTEVIREQTKSEPVVNQVKVRKDEPNLFIPTIEVDDSEVQIRDTKTSSSDKNVFDLARRLRTT